MVRNIIQFIGGLIMEYLHKLFYKDSHHYNQIYTDRFNFETTVKLPLNIQPINQQNIYQLYYTPKASMLKLSNTIQKLDVQLITLFNQLPQLAQNKFIVECIVDELQNTNEIEGVRSTREEIVRSVRALEAKSIQKDDRFLSMVASYSKLIGGELEKLESPEDVRKIYDYLLEGEIVEDDLPDGEIFRKDACSVLKQSGTQQVIHKGIFPESKIISAVSNLITFLNEENDDTPQLLKIIISHYYFGYIHPFYDGNGRTSRFISSLYLKNEYSPITSISISRGCNKYLKKYLDLFEITNKFSSRGEMNCFIDGMLDIIADTQMVMYEELYSKQALLQSANNIIQQDPRTADKSDAEKNILYHLAQDNLFNSHPDVTAQKLAELIDVSIQTIRKTLTNLVDEGLVIAKGNRPKIYTINQEFIEGK